MEADRKDGEVRKFKDSEDKPAVQTPLVVHHCVYEVTEPHKASFSSNIIQLERFFGNISN